MSSYVIITNSLTYYSLTRQLFSFSCTTHQAS